MSSLSYLRPFVRLTIYNPEADTQSAFGRGVAELCKGVVELGSLNAAAKSMRMAYSKAWRIVKDTESALGVQLLNRDGAHGSTLTEEGEQILNAYLQMEEAIEQFSKEKLSETLE